MPRPRPAIPQCPVLAERNARSLARGALGTPSGRSIAIPAEAETPRPSLSCVQVGNEHMTWNYLTGRVTVSAPGGAAEVQLRPGQPVVVDYSAARTLRNAAGNERALPLLIDPRKWDTEKAQNGDHIYCGLLHPEQALPEKLQVKTLLVSVAGCQSDGVSYNKTAGRRATWLTVDKKRVEMGVWVSANTFWLHKPGWIRDDLSKNDKDRAYVTRVPP